MRIYLLGRMAVEAEGEVLGLSAFPGRQGRLAFAALSWDRNPIPRDALAGIIWPEGLPEAWDVALSAVVSKLRRTLERAGIGGAALDGSDGAYQLRLPEGTWVDVREAVNSLDRAGGSLRGGDVSAAWADATVASAILSRPFLPGDVSDWAEARRRELTELRIRTLDCLAEVWLRWPDPALATRCARQQVELAPFRESAYRRLMECLLETGDRAEAIRVYGELRSLLRDELGLDPSPEVEVLYERALGVG